MSEKSFAAASVSVAIIWGTFFYPPTPHTAKNADTDTAVVLAQPTALRTDTRTLRSVKVSNTAVHTVAANNECALGAVHGATDCAPLHKLASD